MRVRCSIEDYKRAYNGTVKALDGEFTVWHIKIAKAKFPIIKETGMMR